MLFTGIFAELFFNTKERRQFVNNLKSLFVHSSDNVIFTDYDFNILWTNKNDDIFLNHNDNCSELFENEKLPLKSGTYFVSSGGLNYECRVIDYPELENGIYVIQINSDDVLYSFMNCRVIEEILTNQSGALRDAVSGISFSNEVLRNRLMCAQMFDEQKYVDITYGNCCKLLKTSMNTMELLHYAQGNISEDKIDFSAYLEEFVFNSEKILLDKIQINSNIQPGLFIRADSERLTAFLLSVVLLANGGNPENNVIHISAERIEDSVSLTVVPGKCGIDHTENKFTNHMKMYDCDEVDTDLFVVNRFCKTFGGTLFTSETEGKAKSFSIRLPYDYSAGSSVDFKSGMAGYTDNLFSKYRIMYSEILY